MDYLDFKALYPRREALAAGKVMWDRLTDSEKSLAIGALPLHIKKWRLEGRDTKFIPLIASWLNPKLGRRWEDEISFVEQEKKSAKFNPVQYVHAELAKALAASPPSQVCNDIHGEVHALLCRPRDD